jgi:lipoprotein-releasing system permease protein
VNLPLFIARRYFLSKRKKNFINLISLLSMLGVAFATAALIVVLSVFNGLGVLLRSIYTAFDPQIKIEAVHGKSFVVTDSLKNSISRVEGVDILTEVIEDYVYVRYQQPDIAIPDDEMVESDQHYTMPKGTAEMVVTMKGVSDNFIDQHRLDNNMIAGEVKLHQANMFAAVVGKGVRNTLSISVESEFVPLQFFYVKNLKNNSFNPASMYAQQNAMPMGVFAIEKSYDENFIFVPLELAKELMSYGDKRTSLEVKLKTHTNIETTQAKLQAALGSNFSVLNNDEQHRDLYRILKIEKLFMALSMALLMAIASINIFFSLMMLVIDKKKDISILASLGASPALIRNIFISEAFVISGIGAIVGLILGAGLCWLQDNVGLVGMGMETAVILNYPVKMVLTDFLFVAGIIVFITASIAWLPARTAAKSVEAGAL